MSNSIRHTVIIAIDPNCLPHPYKKESFNINDPLDSFIGIRCLPSNMKLDEHNGEIYPLTFLNYTFLR